MLVFFGVLFGDILVFSRQMLAFLGVVRWSARVLLGSWSHKLIELYSGFGWKGPSE